MWIFETNIFFFDWEFLCQFFFKLQKYQITLLLSFPHLLLLHLLKFIILIFLSFLSFLTFSYSSFSSSPSSLLHIHHSFSLLFIFTLFNSSEHLILFLWWLKGNLIIVMINCLTFIWVWFFGKNWNLNISSQKMWLWFHNLQIGIVHQLVSKRKREREREEE